MVAETERAQRSALADLDRQIEYWNTAGAEKPFAHPVSFERIEQWLNPESRMLCIAK